MYDLPLINRELINNLIEAWKDEPNRNIFDLLERACEFSSSRHRSAVSSKESNSVILDGLKRWNTVRKSETWETQ
jgi:hypothetical protein